MTSPYLVEKIDCGQGEQYKWYFQEKNECPCAMEAMLQSVGFVSMYKGYSYGEVLGWNGLNLVEESEGQTASCRV